MPQKKDFVKINNWLWEIPKSFRADMRVPARAYVSEKMLEEALKDRSLDQLTNVATLPGIVNYSMAMPDMHEGYGFCVHPETKVLTDFGFSLQIKNFEEKTKDKILKSLDFKLNQLVGTSIEKFIELKAQNKVLEVITKTGKKIITTEDHPFYTKKGMTPISGLKEGNEVAIYPFEGVPYQEPSNKIIIDTKDVRKILCKAGIKKGSKRFNIILQKLENRNFLPLTYGHPKLPYLLKIMGFVFGDASMNFIGKRRNGIFHFAGKAEDLEEARKDLKEIGYTASPIHFRKIKTRTGKLFDSYFFLVNASSLVIFLEALGVPRGSKVDQPFRIPKWIFKCPLWQKRLFLASLFGSELRCPHRRLDRRGNFNAPSFPVSKRIELLKNAKDYLKDIEKLLKEFGVKTLYVEQPKNKKHINTKGQVSWGLNLVISPSLENLLNLWGKIGFEYNKKRHFFACVAVQYLKIKQKTLKEKEEVIKVAIPHLLKLGFNNVQIYQRLAGNPLTKRFIESTCLKIKRGIKTIIPRIPVSFPLFQDYLEKAAQGLGKSGAVWDEIIDIKDITYKNWVYDFTVTHKDHNFIANNFIVSNCIGGVAAMDIENGVISPGGVGYDINCGMRLLKSEFLEKDIKPYLEDLATEIQKEVPSGLGRGRQTKVDISSLNKILEGGAQRLVEQGYGEKEDLENCEAGGKLEQADFSMVSDRAKDRGRDQVGTLGSGNHFLEIQKVGEIFDEKVAEVFGLFESQVVIMIHTGSRGLGHQIATDYIRLMMKAMPKYNINLPDRELAACPFNSPEGQRYFSAMSCGANFAWANRQMIAHYIRKAWKSVLGEKATSLIPLYDVAHNIAKIEKYVIGDKEVELCIHRKGATRAFPPGHSEIPERYREVGQPVLIPGSMGTASYILAGVKESESVWHTTCHGAGRTMSRHQAVRTIDAGELIKKLEEKGILIKCWSLRGIAEEAPQAYKNIDEVVEVVHNAGLSKKIARLMPLAVIKGE